MVITFALITMVSAANAALEASRMERHSFLIIMFLKALHLEGVARTELNIARSVALGQRRFLSEGRRREARGWSAENHVVERVEHFDPERNDRRLCNAGGLFDHGIEIPVGRTVDVREVARCRAEGVG